MTNVNGIHVEEDLEHASRIRNAFYSFHLKKGESLIKQFVPLSLDDDNITMTPIKDLNDMGSISSNQVATLGNSLKEISTIDFGRFSYPISDEISLTRVLKDKANVLVFGGQASVDGKDTYVAVKFVKLKNKEDKLLYNYLNKLDELRKVYEDKEIFVDAKSPSKNAFFPCHNEYTKDVEAIQRRLDNNLFLNEGMQEILIYLFLYPHLFYGNLLIYDKESKSFYTMLIMKRLVETAYELTRRYINNIYNFEDMELNIQKLYDMLVQLIFVTIPLSRNNAFRHNDCKIDNIGYSNNQHIKHIYLEVTDNDTKTTSYYKIPTRKKIFTLFDFGWSNFQIQNKKVYNFYSRTPIEVFQNKQWMFIENPCTDLIQMTCSIIRSMGGQQFSEIVLENDTNGTIQNAVTMLDDFTEMLYGIIKHDRNQKYFKPISPATQNVKDLGSKYPRIPASKEKWGQEMYIPISELCTYFCKDRRRVLFNLLLPYEMSNQDIIAFKLTCNDKEKDFPYLLRFSY